MNHMPRPWERNAASVADAAEQRWAARTRQGRCDDALTALLLDVAPLSLCETCGQASDEVTDNRTVVLARKARCADSSVCELYSTAAPGGAAGAIGGHHITAELIWDARWGRHCYFLWVFCAASDTILWEGCRRAICPTGMYRLHRNGGASNDVGKLIVT